nr:hypothetical protein [Coxiella-like endosymbiont of Rhipicephalus sanguineus]
MASEDIGNADSRAL